MRDDDAASRRRGSALSLQLQRLRDPADAMETISSSDVAHDDRDDRKQMDKQSPESSDTWHHRLQSSFSTSTTPTHRRPRGSIEVAQSLEELTEISSISAVIELQRWWRKHSSSGQKVAQLQTLCRRHVVTLIHRRRTASARSKLHAIALQILFLVIFTYSTLHGYAHDRLYRLMRATTSQYLDTPFISSSQKSKTFLDVTNTQEFVEWLQGPFLAVSYSDLSTSSTVKTNRIIGGIRIGQLRVQSFNCSSRVTSFFSSSELDNTIDNAYYCFGSSDGDFTMDTETKETISVSNGDSYVFKGLNDTSTAMERSALFSTMSVSTAQYSLPAPAFSVVLPRSNGVQASSILETLRTNRYLDSQTRAVMLDLSLYNVMVRHLITLRFLVELPASGGAIASLSAGVAPLTSSFLFDGDHWITSACHLIVIMFYAYFFLDEVLALARSHSRQWQHQAIWQRSNLKKIKAKRKTRPSPLHRRHGASVRLLGLLCYVITWLLRLVALVKRPSELPMDSDRFVPLRPYTETFRAAQLALSVSVCLAWIELLLMLRVTFHVDLLVRAVVCAAPQLFVLIVLIALVAIGYASACLVVLGAQSSLFQSLPEALRSLLVVLLQTGSGGAGVSSLLGFSSISSGQIGHDAAGTSTLRTLLFSCFLLFNVFVASNLFLVVIYEGYVKAKRDIEADQMQSQLRMGRDDDGLEAAPVHLDLWFQTAVYGREVGAKLVNLVSHGLTLIFKGRRAVEMQSTVLPADMSNLTMKLVPEQDKSEDENCSKKISSSRRFPRAKYTEKSASQNREVRDSPSTNTLLLEGMVLQLALQNEALLRAVNELKQDVQAFKRGGESSTNDRDVLRHGSVAPLRVHKQRKTSVGSTFVMIPDAADNQLL